MSDDNFGLPVETLIKIKQCLSAYEAIQWVKVFGSRATGTYRKGSDIDLAYASKQDITGRLLTALNGLPTPYQFDVVHYDTLDNARLKAEIDEWGRALV